MAQEEKTSLEKAFLDFKNLKESTKKELMTQLEEKVEDKILALINEMDESQNQIEKAVENVSNKKSEKNQLEEDVTVTIDVKGDDVEVTTDDDDADMGDVEDFEKVEPPVKDVEDEDEIFEFTHDAEPYEITNEMNSNLEEQEPVQPAGQEMPQQQPAAEVPAEAPAEAPVDAPAPEMDGDAESKIIDGIKELIAQTDAGAGMGAAPAGDGEIDIVDDEAGAAQQPVAEEFDENEIFEIIEDGLDYDIDLDSDEMERVGPSDEDISWEDVYSNVRKGVHEDEEYEIAFEIDEDMDESEDGESVEEMKAMGHGHGVRKTAGKGAGPEVAVKNRSRQTSAINETKSQARKEAKIAELVKENESLKREINKKDKDIKKFHDSFVELRSQFNEMQTFNAKLAYANKLFASGGFSEKEKIQIAESFDSVDTADQAKELYNKIVNKSKISTKDIQSEISAPSTKTAKPKTNKRQKSEHNVLYENAEMKRMRQLAGIKSQNS